MNDYSYVGNELEQAQNAVNWKAYFRSRVGKHVSGRVLEVGAGLGGTTIRLRTTDATEWVCLEPDSALATRLNSTLEAHLSDVPTRVIVGDLNVLPNTELFDCILYIDVLEHIADDAAELKHASQHLTAGGKLVVLCPAFQFLFSELDRAVGHYRRYTKRSLCSVFPA